jgi:hypothetical protein
MLATVYKVKLCLTEPLLGTVPKSESVYADYLAGKAVKRKEHEATIPVEEAIALAEEELATVGDEEKKGWTGFHSDDDGLFVFDYQIKGFFKEAGSMIKDFDEVKVKNLKSKIDNYVYVMPRRIRLGAAEPLPLERPLRAMTMQGPRVSLMRSDQISAGAVLEFELRVLPQKEITGELIEQLLEVGEYKGLGQWRNGSYGRFSYTIER